jgi:alkanesulfonate monooxygenase SsuD/methylene tetrahydromethanopterin reductase-like flavin-dependent oxidoreductase (luciferase family)
MRRAGRIADGFLGSSTGRGGIEAFSAAKQAVLEGLGEAGRDPAAFTFALHVPVFAWDDGDAWETVKPWYHYLRWKYPDMGGSRGRGGGPARPPALSVEIESQLRPTILCGRPDEVIAEIDAYRDALGDDTHFICRSYFSGMPADVQAHAIALLGERVLPSLR